jgi:hypothetical protein
VFDRLASPADNGLAPENARINRDTIQHVQLSHVLTSIDNTWFIPSFDGPESVSSSISQVVGLEK